jgi:hypothetical protein
MIAKEAAAARRLANLSPAGATGGPGSGDANFELEDDGKCRLHPLVNKLTKKDWDGLGEEK